MNQFEQLVDKVEKSVSVIPVKLERVSDDRLQIHWNDGRKTSYEVRNLRDRCPCATCREKRTKPEEPEPLLRVLSPEETVPLRITGMKPVGNYAYTIQFSDGHDTGIYAFDFLRQLGEENAPQERK